MISYKKLLVPIDFSENSKRAVTYGLTLAAQLNARLILAHIVSDLSALNYAFPSETYEAEKQQYEKARAAIRKLIPQEFAARFDIETIVKTGKIESELLGIVSDERIDLIVMGTQGRRNLGHWFIGSVTESILRNSPVPLLTVSHLRPGNHAVELGFVALKNILYASDMSDSSAVGIQYAIELARGTGARLTVAHVVDYARFILLSGTASGYLEAERKKWAGSLKKDLDALVEREKPADMEIERVVLEGKPHEQLLQYAHEHSVDMVVLNIQGRGMIDRALLGSTAERVVRFADIPVLSIPVAVLGRANSA